ncbi:probable 2-oxoglutarate-dependent dioxygenase AOP1 [Aristolochia californica]|uniref:probable 2-oxoglutarate-dependent dioxygenase AOP1 n=1 Tax=Aristolochia californica TaxID=171875 RepID=UPI0035D5D811
MGQEGATEIPFLDLCKGSERLEPGSERWDGLCREVRDACEKFGCFIVTCDAVPRDVLDGLFQAMKPLFDLPPERKKKNINPKPYFGYVGDLEAVPLYESFGVESATDYDVAQSFTRLMWPEGNPEFCQGLYSTSRRMLELEMTIRKMAFDSFGIGNQFDSHVRNTGCVFRVMKYKATPSDESTIGLLAHTDKNILTILSQDELGLQVESKHGDWIDVPASKGSFIVLVGESLKIWSNGRFHAANHRVVVKDKERYSCGIFSVPNEGWTLEVPEEMADTQHPLLFKPFNFMEYLSFFYSKIDKPRENTVEAFAGISVN